MIDEKRIAEIRERCEKASPGPWNINNVEIGNGKRICLFENQIQGTDNKPVGATDSNAGFIAHAREDIPYLLDCLAESQRREQAAVSDMQYIHCAGRYGCRICLNNDVCKCQDSHIGRCDNFDWRGPQEVEK